MTNPSLTPLEELRKLVARSNKWTVQQLMGITVVHGTQFTYASHLDEALLEIEKRDAALTEANKEILGLRAIGLDPEIYNKRDNEIERLQSQVDVLSYRAPTESAKLIKELEEKWFVFKEEMNQRNEAVLKYSESQSKLIDEARKVIEFYGDKTNWLRNVNGWRHDMIVLDLDDETLTAWEGRFSGKRARAFLAKLDGGK